MARTSITYLGQIISKEGVRIDESQLNVIKDYPAPRSVKEIQRVMGLFNYYRKWIPKYSFLAKPIMELLRKDRIFKWTNTQETAFQELKVKLVTAPILTFPQWELPFKLICDASQQCISAILSQEIDGIENVVVYASKILNTAEQKWAIIEKEAFAVYWGILHYRAYLWGRKFYVTTDHAPLKWFFKVKETATGRLARWAIFLSEYDYEVQPRPGKENTNADTLSRLPENHPLMEIGASESPKGSEYIQD